MKTRRRMIIAVMAAAMLSPWARAWSINHAQVDKPPLIQPAELAKLLRKPAKGPKPLVIQIGFRVLYEQAHIPGSQYLGPASEESGLNRLRARVKTLSRKTPIIIYCGCCPWNHCPNIKPAYAALRATGFTNVKALWMARNFGADWVEKGYPVVRR